MRIYIPNYVAAFQAQSAVTNDGESIITVCSPQFASPLVVYCMAKRIATRQAPGLLRACTILAENKIVSKSQVMPNAFRALLELVTIPLCDVPRCETVVSKHPSYRSATISQSRVERNTMKGAKS